VLDRMEKRIERQKEGQELLETVFGESWTVSQDNLYKR
jgi:hypothetical protein